VEPCAGGVVFDEVRRLLLVRRARPPGAGLWTIPGGRCLPGEAPADACVRELSEETALVVRVLRHVGAVRRPGPVADVVYEIDDYLCERLSGSLRAGDDADDARWVSLAQLRELPTVPGLLDALAEWEMLPA
jgi:ADP-ribose pyrophosphatase YjhB (NUDIX family)